jgi:hypothetical protein
VYLWIIVSIFQIGDNCAEEHGKFEDSMALPVWHSEVIGSPKLWENCGCFSFLNGEDLS